MAVSQDESWRVQHGGLRCGIASCSVALAPLAAVGSLQQVVNRPCPSVRFAEIRVALLQISAEHLKVSMPHQSLEGVDVSTCPQAEQGEGAPKVVGAGGRHTSVCGASPQDGAKPRASQSMTLARSP